jgi:5-methylcytosine-specific restriction endonuclease McrA
MIDAAKRRRVRERAGNGCEYCGMRQADEQFLTYQIEHIVPRQHGGGDDDDNLALACPQCNLHKGPNLAGIDPLSGAIEPLFNPRRQAWEDHFESRGPYLFGRTPTGRVTIRVLAMNDEARIDLRGEVGRGE